MVSEVILTMTFKILGRLHTLVTILPFTSLVRVVWDLAYFQIVT